MRLDHVHQRSPDPVGAARFYVDALGAAELRREGEPVSRVVVDLGGLTLFIERATEGLAPGATAPHLGLEHLGLGVDDIDAALAHARARGARVVTEVKELRPGLKIAFLDTPDGVRVELLQRG